MGELTAEEVSLIQNMWHVLDRNLYDVGDVMLFKFFEKYPNYKKMFPKFRDTPLNDLKGSRAFRNHAYQIMVQFTKSINLLNKPGGIEEIRALWRAHGELHANLNVTKQQFNLNFRKYETLSSLSSWKFVT
ncbi:globin CTT-VI-like [Culicoides brevitarsis]|uniref:globin CTT-VI-like n=1 Tax=Culicoides brevitarsis TaxID=469753 RepID=UPI00307B28D5